MEDVYEKRESLMSWFIISKYMWDVLLVFDVVIFEVKLMYKSVVMKGWFNKFRKYFCFCWI